MTQEAMDWDLSSYFPEFNGPEMQQFKKELQEDIASLRDQAAALDPLNADNADAWEDVFLQYEKIIDRLSHLGSYIGCLSAADARNENYSQEEAAYSLIGAESAKLDVETLRALKGVSDEDFPLL